MAFEICSRLGHAPPTFYIFRNGSIPESWTHFGRPFFLESNVSRHRWLKINYGESVAASRLFLSPVIRFSGIQSVPHWLLSAPRSWSPIISFSLLFLFSVLSNNISFLKFRMNGEKTGLSSQLLNFDLCRAECAIGQFLFFFKFLFRSAAEFSNTMGEIHKSFSKHPFLFADTRFSPLDRRL